MKELPHGLPILLLGTASKVLKVDVQLQSMHGARQEAQWYSTCLPSSKPQVLNLQKRSRKFNHLIFAFQALQLLAYKRLLFYGGQELPVGKAGCLCFCSLNTTLARVEEAEDSKEWGVSGEGSAVSAEPPLLIALASKGFTLI